MNLFEQKCIVRVFYFVIQSNQVATMKMMLRIAAVLSFGCCFAGGLGVLRIAASSPSKDLNIISALGLVVVGMSFFAGSMIWMAAERCRPRHDGEEERRQMTQL